MPPRMMGVRLNVRLIRFPYTMHARSGRAPAAPPGVYASERRRFFATVKWFTIESMLPADTRNPRRGSPNTHTLAGSRQSGCAMTPTR